VHETADLKKAVADADVVILATPVGTMPAILREISSFLKPGSIVTDVGSTKKTVIEEAEKVLGPGIHFVGGHPMAGSESSGFAGADPYLLEYAYYLLTPTRRTNPEALKQVRRLVEGIGAVVIEIPPDEHELITAAISHLPHLVAAALVNAVTTMPAGNKALALSAGGFRDTTRIAAGNPQMWTDIFVTNRDRVLQTLNYFRGTLDELESAIRNTDRDKIYRILDHAGKTRRELPLKSKGYLPYVYEVVVTVPDRPGMIAMLSAMLADSGINITEIEILRAREGYGGTIRIGFSTPEEQEKAYNLLISNNIRCRRKT